MALAGSIWKMFAVLLRVVNNRGNTDVGMSEGKSSIPVLPQDETLATIQTCTELYVDRRVGPPIID